MRRLAIYAALLLASPAAAQPFRVDYTLTVDPADLSGYAVEMRIPHAPATLRLAMAAHPEYDDRFFRYVRDFRVESAGGRAGTFVREDSVVWRIQPAGGDAVVRYRIELPPQTARVRTSWTAWLSPTGGLVGGPHSFMYVIGQERAPSRVELRLPRGWTAATSLEPAGGAFAYTAPDFATLMDSPMLVGRLRHWRFAVAGVPHEAAYWPRPDGVAFDTTALVDALRGIVAQSAAIFHGLPYRRFVFLLQDGAYGGLEHENSASLGAPSEELAGDRADFLLSAAHEYFHAWNEVRLRPAGWGGLSYLPPSPTRELWWTEGATMYYADLVLRRAGLERSSRLEALRSRLSSYLDNPGSAHVSPEQASWTVNDPPGANGGFSADLWEQGRLIATVLDLAIRDSTAGRRSLDDVMRALVAEHPAPRGFTGMDVERTAGRVCGCSFHRFFERHVRGSELLDFAAALRPLGLRTRVTMQPEVDSAGHPQPDLRVWAYTAPGERRPRLVIDDPRSAWARAGLRTRDVVVAMNGAEMPDRRTFITALRALHTGDRPRLDILRDGHPLGVEVPVGGYQTTRVTFEDLPRVTAAQRAARARWLAAAP
ncbi:MAG TPA: hypothetical protein VJT67_02645 [Longimicrobiaceae bacterium]|nr:hypothetical protein [Longimicrobiaceae bacterium]